MDAIAKVEAEIEAVEQRIKEAGRRYFSALEAGDPTHANYWRDKEKQLREEKKQLREEKKQLREEKLKLLDIPAAKSVPSDILLFWGFLKSAKELQKNIEVDSNIVASSLSLSPSPPSELRVYKRRRSVTKVKVVLNTLKLEGGTRLPHIQIDELYVRKVYVKFTNIAFEILKGEKRRVQDGSTQLVRHLFVTGSPGNGKTIWGYYLLYRLSKEDLFSDRAIVWEDCPKQGPGVSYYFKGTDVRFGYPGDFDTLVDENAIFLVNGPVLRTRQMVSHIIMFCSAKDAAVTKDVVKHTVYMPMWDLCELVLAGAITGRSDSSIKKVHKKFGGSARLVLLQHGDYEWDKRFEDALTAVKNKAALTYTVGSMLEAKESSSFIFHLKVTDDECQQTAVMFASRYVEDKIESLAKLDDLASVVEYVQKHKFHKDEAALVGKRFEFLFHRLMSCREASEFVFKARKMGSKDIVNLRFTLNGNIGTFHKLDKVPDGSLGYSDYETYPWYDSILFLKDETSAFQVTMNKRHPALLDYVEELLDDHLLSKFYYVVPEEIFMEFPVQKCMQGSAEYEWPDEVAVWVLQIPADFFNFHKQQ